MLVSVHLGFLLWTYSIMANSLCGEFPLHALCWLMWGFSYSLSLTHPVMVMVICEECLLQVTHPFPLVYVPNVGSFSFTHTVLVYVVSFS